MSAPPGSRTYGVPSVKLAWYASVRRAGPVPRTVFWPVPRVDSGLVAFTRREPPPGAGRDEVFAVVDAAFAQRRKTLRARAGAVGRLGCGRRAGAQAGGDRPGAARRIAGRGRVRADRRGRAPRDGLTGTGGSDEAADDGGVELGVADVGLAERLTGARVRHGRGTAYHWLIVTAVTVRVPAKLNLQLSVGPRRDDGYHDLVTVFHAVSLLDEVTVRPADRTSVSVTGRGRGVGPGRPGEPRGPRGPARWPGRPAAPGRGRGADRDPQADPGRGGPGRGQRGRRRRPGRVQRAVGLRPDPGGTARRGGAGGQRRPVRAARRDRGRAGPG